MSQYALAADLYALGLPSAALGDLSADAITAALVAASGAADGYLATRYKLPLVSCGDEVTRRVCHLAAFDLLTTRGTRPGDALDLIVKRNDDAIAWFRDVSRGLVQPAGIVDATPTFDEQHPVLATGDALFATGDGVWTDEG